MQKNIHPKERVIRVLLGILVLSVGLWGPNNYWFLLGIIPLMTGLVGWCPPYAFFGINTCKIWKSQN